MKLSAVMVIICCLLLSACESDTLAPVTEGWRQPTSVQGSYRVQAGDTLYSIAFRFGEDYRAVAGLNGIHPPYELHVGQQIYLAPQNVSQQRKVIVIKKQIARHVAKTDQQAQRLQKQPSSVQRIKRTVASKKLGPVRRWYWPTRGRLVKRFSSKNKGIDISGRYGQAIFAAAAGRVVYAGHGLAAYGNLIIIKHNADYMTAYAYNSRLFVREGQYVKARQKIADMGKSRTGNILLHFELRRAGKPIDPRPFLRKN